MSALELSPDTPEKVFAWQLLPYKPESFIFNSDLLINMPKEAGPGLLAYPEEIIKANNVFFHYCWDVFFSLGNMIKKRLKDKYPKKKYPTQSKRINEEHLFSFSFKLEEGSDSPGLFSLALEEWVANDLNFPRTVESRNDKNCPWKAFSEIMAKLLS